MSKFVKKFFNDLDNDKLNKILIIRLSSLGDVLLTTPIIRALKKKYNEAEIDYIVKQNYSDALRYNPYLKNVIYYSETKQFRNQLRESKYDLVIDLQNNFRSRRIVSSLNSASIRFKKPTLKKFLLVNFKINLYNNVKQIPILYAESIRNLELDDKGLDLFLPGGIKSEIPDGKQFIGFCPGAKHFTKRWPEEYFIELGNNITEAGYSIIIFGGKDDKEICNNIHQSVHNSICICGEDNIFEIAINMRKCKLIICNDSGLMHTATAMNIPVIAIFGSSAKEFGFTPYSSPNVHNLVLENNSLFCRPCSHYGKNHCPKKHFKCMKDISPFFVKEQILSLIKTI
ncbi:glycosyltransferase family 9 protein [Melioribacteraceae bacterium 4301-Me]|uniref:glycosyltransferase family 9 protein n=1 Tax=Pyranulibacter aquaticus TaxID=3163344 RepID=UPI003596ED4C